MIPGKHYILRNDLCLLDYSTECQCWASTQYRHQATAFDTYGEASEIIEKLNLDPQKTLIISFQGEYDPGPVEAVRDKYESRIRAQLEMYRVALTAAGYDCDPVRDRQLDEFGWSLDFYVGPRNPNDRWENCVGVEFTIMESTYHDQEMVDGINFKLEIPTGNGLILGTFCPANYTPNCWVDAKNSVAVARRFALLEEVTPAEIVDVVKKGIAGLTPA